MGRKAGAIFVLCVINAMAAPGQKYFPPYWDWIQLASKLLFVCGAIFDEPNKRKKKEDDAFLLPLLSRILEMTKKSEVTCRSRRSVTTAMGPS